LAFMFPGPRGPYGRPWPLARAWALAKLNGRNRPKNGRRERLIDLIGEPRAGCPAMFDTPDRRFYGRRTTVLY